MAKSNDSSETARSSDRLSALSNWSWWAVTRLPIPLLAAAGAYWLWFSPIQVEQIAPRRGSIAQEVVGTGTLEARVSMTISSKISGRIDRVLADQGDRVTRGSQLVQLEDDELRQQLAIAEANVEAAKASIVRQAADKQRAIAVFEQSKRHLLRIKELYEKNATTTEDMERATESLSVATSDVSRAEAAVTESQKLLIAAEKTREYHQARLNDTNIAAPFDGMIIERFREAGDVAVPGAAILTLISTDELWINAWVDETEIDRLAVGQPARIVFRSRAGQSLVGSVARLAKQSDRETREFIVDVKLENLPENWAVGQRADVYIQTTGKEDVLQLPSRMISRTPLGEGVFVNDNGYAVWRKIKLGLRGREVVEVLEGLDDTEAVIVALDSKRPLESGRRVQLK